MAKAFKHFNVLRLSTSNRKLAWSLVAYTVHYQDALARTRNSLYPTKTTYFGHMARQCKVSVKSHYRTLPRPIRRLPAAE